MRLYRATETVRGRPMSSSKPEVRLDLKLLWTCRQLYQECNQVLWITNTFSFIGGELFVVSWAEQASVR